MRENVRVGKGMYRCMHTWQCSGLVGRPSVHTFTSLANHFGVELSILLLLSNERQSGGLRVPQKSLLDSRHGVRKPVSESAHESMKKAK